MNTPQRLMTEIGFFCVYHCWILKSVGCDIKSKKCARGQMFFPSIVCCGLAGLEHYDDINQPVSMAEADAIRETVGGAVASVLPGAQIVLTGGFRRSEINHPYS
ncbi:hypothetical protein ILYODFUR_028774 [Ilyodon furcidens]|uniref:Uncharacterized protein n=1 Tax=Ilyodon furcidens TaxID=33524 RepID=A0ABV0VI21_9TELE